MSPLEKAGAIAGVCVPAAALIWYGSVIVSEVNSLHDRVGKLEDAQDAYAQAQAVDETVNEKVKALEAHVDWLRFHHHHVIEGTSDTGGAHVD